MIDLPDIYISLSILLLERLLGLSRWPYPILSFLVEFCLLLLALDIFRAQKNVFTMWSVELTDNRDLRLRTLGYNKPFTTVC